MSEQKHTTKTILVDSNLLVYLADASDPKKHRTTKALFRKIEKNPRCFVIAVQNLREFASIMLKKKAMPPEKIRKYLNLFENAFYTLLADTAEDVRMATHSKMPFWDSLLIATMKRNQVTVLYTENIRDFKSSEIQIINPLSD